MNKTNKNTHTYNCNEIISVGPAAPCSAAPGSWIAGVQQGRGWRKSQHVSTAAPSRLTQKGGAKRAL
eukprot:4180212-Amphidinium_carterae.1